MLIVFCFQNFLSGVKVGLISNILILHKSVGMVNEKWDDNKTKFESKYLNNLPICLNEETKHIIFDKDLPKIDMHVLCWNEEKMIPYFLNHYENLVSRIFVYDNKSTDNNKSIDNIKSLISNQYLLLFRDNPNKDTSYYSYAFSPT